LLNISVIR